MSVILPARFSAGTTFRATCDRAATLHMRGLLSIDLPARDGAFVAGADETSHWLAGDYAWCVRATDDLGGVTEIARGSMTVAADMTRIPPGTDMRSQNRQAYDAICAVIANRASLDQQSYKINNRELVRMDVADLMRLKSHYGFLVRREQGHSPFRAYLAEF